MKSGDRCCRSLVHEPTIKKQIPRVARNDKHEKLAVARVNSCPSFPRTLKPCPLEQLHQTNQQTSSSSCNMRVVLFFCSGFSASAHAWQCRKVISGGFCEPWSPSPISAPR